MKRLGLILLVVGAVAALTIHDWDVEVVPDGSPTYVGAASCKECHNEEFCSWESSHHHFAMAKPDARTVLGDFEAKPFVSHGVETRFAERGGQYFMTTEGADGKTHEYPVAFTFGWTPLQQYVLDLGNGRMQVPAVAWDEIQKRWYSIYDEPIPPGDELHWTGPQFTWNHMCVECHVTDFAKGFDASIDGYKTRWSEPNVSCEACHGPSSEHVALEGKGGLVLNVKGRGSRQVESCAPCHSRRSRLTPTDDLSEPFLSNYDPALLTEGLYHADGQIEDEVYVWGSFMQSKMHSVGVQCSDCHDSHNGQLLREGDALCTHCHQETPPEEFPTLKKRVYDDVIHHGHTPETEGSACVECHMPAKNYMGIDARHDHSLRIPRPDLSVAIGTPNACNGCHEDRPPEWAAEAATRMGDGTAWETPHYGTVFAAARNNDAAAIPGLVRILHGEAAPAIVRATAALELARFPSREAIDALLDAFDDKEALVRAAAVRAMASQPWRDPSIQADIQKLLEDPLRLVRVSATAAWRGPVPEPLPAAWRELDERNAALSDRAEGAYNAAIAQERRGKPELAIVAYKHAIERDPNFFRARLNLGHLLARTGRTGEAEDVFREAVAADATNGPAYYNLGLLYADLDRWPDAMAAMAAAMPLLPYHARLRYNYGLALDKAGRGDEAGAVLKAAHDLDPNDRDILHAVVAFFVGHQNWDEALRYARLYAKLVPDDPTAEEMVRALEVQRKR